MQEIKPDDLPKGPATLRIQQAIEVAKSIGREEITITLRDFELFLEEIISSTAQKTYDMIQQVLEDNEDHETERVTTDAAESIIRRRKK